MSRPRPPFRVQIVNETPVDYFRNAELGARHYGFDTGRLVFADRWLHHELTGNLGELVRRDQIQGVVAALHFRPQERRFAALPVPVVNISNTVLAPTLPVVTLDDESVGRLAASHLLSCGCRAFGFWGQQGARYSGEQLKGFRSALEAAGFAGRVSVSGSSASGRSFARMRTWLASLPRPAGVFSVLDALALALMRAAGSLGVRVPEDLAILGAADDHFWVRFESIPLSSIRVPDWRIGYEAAALLDRLIASGRRQAESVHLPVNEVAARRSTDILFVEDHVVARALQYIRSRATENPYVVDVARAAGVSTSALHTRFRRVVQRSVNAELGRVRLMAVERLLSGTDLPMSIVAERCGFPNSQRLSLLFRKSRGQTPSAYRKLFRNLPDEARPMGA